MFSFFPSSLEALLMFFFKIMMKIKYGKKLELSLQKMGLFFIQTETKIRFLILKQLIKILMV